MTTHQRLGNGDNTPMTYSPEQLDMLRYHFERCGAPTNRIGLDHWLSTRVDDALRISVVAQLFPGHVTQRDYAQDLINAGVPVNAVRKSLAMVMAPADRDACSVRSSRTQSPMTSPTSAVPLGRTSRVNAKRAPSRNSRRALGNLKQPDHSGRRSLIFAFSNLLSAAFIAAQARSSCSPISELSMAFCNSSFSLAQERFNSFSSRV